MVMVKLGLSYWGFRRSLRRGLLSPGFVIGYVGLWLSGAGGLAAWACSLAVSGMDWNPQVLALIPATVLIVPLARIAVSPLALAMNRHR